MATQHNAHMDDARWRADWVRACRGKLYRVDSVPLLGRGGSVYKTEIRFVGGYPRVVDVVHASYDPLPTPSTILPLKPDEVKRQCGPDWELVACFFVWGIHLESRLNAVLNADAEPSECVREALARRSGKPAGRDRRLRARLMSHLTKQEGQLRDAAMLALEWLDWLEKARRKEEYEEKVRRGRS